MYKFCDSLDIRYISSLKKKDRDSIKNIVEDVKLVDATKIQNNKLHLYYILASYFRPESINSFELSDLSMDNFCDFFESIKIPKTRVKKLFYTVYNYLVLSGLNPKMDKYSDRDLYTIFEMVDKVYFNNVLNEYIKDKKINLTFRLNNTFTKTKGLSTIYGSNCSIELDISMFDKPFKKQKINGLVCYTKLECMLNVFIHELVHLIIFVSGIEKNIPRDNCKSFKNITRSLFGHKYYKNNLLIDPEIKYITSKQSVKVAELRKKGYISFEDWLQNSNNLYVGRRGRIWIHSKDNKKIFHYADSKWANPFKVDKECSLENSLRQYTEYLLKSDLLNDIHELKGKSIGCWCTSHNCHANILMDISNGVYPYINYKI
jgi:hypothetical protein